MDKRPAIEAHIIKAIDHDVYTKAQIIRLLMGWMHIDQLKRLSDYLEGKTLP